MNTMIYAEVGDETFKNADKLFEKGNPLVPKW